MLTSVMATVFAISRGAGTVGVGVMAHALGEEEGGGKAENDDLFFYRFHAIFPDVRCVLCCDMPSLRTMRARMILCMLVLDNTN